MTGKINDSSYLTNRNSRKIILFTLADEEAMQDALPNTNTARYTHIHTRTKYH